MADVLRVARVRAFGDRPATESYVTRVTERPAFKKAFADQMAHFARMKAKITWTLYLYRAVVGRTGNRAWDINIVSP